MKGVSQRGINTFLLVVVFSLLFVQIVSAATILDDIKSGLGNLFNLSVGSEGDNLLVAKILLFVLVALIVYAVSEFVPFLDKRGPVAALIAIVVGILAVFFLKSEEIYTVLTSYGAFGIALTLIIPFILMAVISKRLYEKEYVFASKIIWVIFIVAIIMKYLIADNIGVFGKTMFYIVLLITLLMLLWEQKLWHFVFVTGIKTARESGQDEALAEVTARLEELRGQITNAPSETVAAPLITRFNRLAKRQRELGGNMKDWGK